ncbi:MAG: hypothetical protein ONA90_08160 [candidate division KSB1 bacterium]|nr:hypothetical protein [candidate division KSB1 bacterium]
MANRMYLKMMTVMLLLLSVSFFNIACEHTQPTTSSTTPSPLTPTFSSIQANIFTPRCVNAGCHPGGAAPVDLALTANMSYGNLVNRQSAYGSPRLLRVSPGDANNSVLYLKVIGDARVGGIAGRMPLGQGALSTDQINAIRDWINAGAQNN